MRRTLMLTVGSGDKRDLEASLYHPLCKSITDGKWEAIILLPSHRTMDRAEEVKQRLPEYPISI